MYGRGDCGWVKGVGLFWEEKGGGLNRREHWGDSERESSLIPITLEGLTVILQFYLISKRVEMN